MINLSSPIQSGDAGTRPLPAQVANVAELEELLSRPTRAARAGLAQVEGDLLILGAGGKMGPTLARMAVRTLAALGRPARVYAAARFSQPGLRDQLEAAGVQTIACDLLDRKALAALPDCPNIIFMAGQKFGTTGAQSLTWALNTHLPALVCERFLPVQPAIVAFSTGNIYPLTPVSDGGSREEDEPQPVGEYAASCLGRERIFEHFARAHGLRSVLLRLNYAVELRYGVLVDIARKVYAGEPVALEMGAANMIWQGDANGLALALLPHCAAPPLVVNVTGPETISVRRVAEEFGRLLGREPVLSGSPAPTALLSNAGRAHRLFGYPEVPLGQMVAWIADWVSRGGASLDKPTHFETRDGRF